MEYINGIINQNKLRRKTTNKCNEPNIVCTLTECNHHGSSVIDYNTTEVENHRSYRYHRVGLGIYMAFKVTEQLK